MMIRSRFRLVMVLASLAIAGAGAGRPVAGQVPGEEQRAAFHQPGALPFFYDLYTFRGENGRTAVVAAVAVATRWLERRDVGGEDVYRFNVSFVLADTATRVVFRTDDSVSVAAPSRLPDEHLLYTQVAVQAPPSATTVQRVVMTDPNVVGVGQLYDASFPIPDYGGSELMLSDIALGQPQPEGGLDREGNTVAILPLARFPESSLDLYYEIYNMPASARYVTEISFEPVDGEGGPAESGSGIRFQGRAPEARGTVRELRRLTADLERGLYRLTVTVRVPATGESARRSHVFEIQDSDAGATLVLARPRR